MNGTKIKNDYVVYADTERDEMLRFVPNTAQTILDVGCSVGNFGSRLKSTGVSEVWGVEVDSGAARIAGGRLDKVLNGPFGPGLKFEDKKFDCIVFNDVLEHMVDPYGALQFAKTLLNQNGKIVASVPNVRYFGNLWMLLVHKSWKYEDSGILDKTHLRFFTEKSIRSMFLDEGFKIEHMEGINPLERFDGYFMRKFKIVNLLTFNQMQDSRWLQFAVVASPSSSKSNIHDESKG